MPVLRFLERKDEREFARAAIQSVARRNRRTRMRGVGTWCHRSLHAGRHPSGVYGRDLHRYLSRLKESGLGTLPGTAAEVLDDEVRAIICPDKINTARWIEVMKSAHRAGFKTTATIMYGHVDGYAHWARHLLRL